MTKLRKIHKTTFPVYPKSITQRWSVPMKSDTSIWATAMLSKDGLKSCPIVFVTKFVWFSWRNLLTTLSSFWIFYCIFSLFKFFSSYSLGVDIWLMSITIFILNSSSYSSFSSFHFWFLDTGGTDIFRMLLRFLHILIWNAGWRHYCKRRPKYTRRQKLSYYFPHLRYFTRSFCFSEEAFFIRLISWQNYMWIHVGFINK